MDRKQLAVSSVLSMSRATTSTAVSTARRKKSRVPAIRA